MMAMDGTQTDSVGGWRGEHSLRSTRSECVALTSLDDSFELDDTNLSIVRLL